MYRALTSCVAFAVLTVSTPVMAQTFTPAVITEFDMSQFWTAAFAGIILALGLQAIMTAISVAAGISFTPDLMRLEAKRKAASMSAQDKNSFSYDHDDEEEEKEQEVSMTIYVPMSVHRKLKKYETHIEQERNRDYTISEAYTEWLKESTNTMTI